MQLRESIHRLREYLHALRESIHRLREYFHAPAAAADQRILGTIRKQLVSEDKTTETSRSENDNRLAWMRR